MVTAFLAPSQPPRGLRGNVHIVVSFEKLVVDFLFVIIELFR